MLDTSTDINQLVITRFISLLLFLFFFILLSFHFNIIDEIIKLTVYLFNSALFSYIKYAILIKLGSPLIIIVLG